MNDRDPYQSEYFLKITNDIEVLSSSCTNANASSPHYHFTVDQYQDMYRRWNAELNEMRGSIEESEPEPVEDPDIEEEPEEETPTFFDIERLYL